MTPLSLLVLMSVAGVTVACHHREGPASADPTYLLTRLPWKYTKYMVNGQAIDNPTDTINFRADGTSILSDGKNSTDGSRWEFSSGNRELIFNKGTSSQTKVEIVELTPNRLEFRSAAPGPKDGGDAIEVELVH